MPPRSKKKLDFEQASGNNQVIMSMFLSRSSPLKDHAGKVAKINELIQNHALGRAAGRILRYLVKGHAELIRKHGGKGIKEAITQEWKKLAQGPRDEWKELMKDFMSAVYNASKANGSHPSRAIKDEADRWMKLNDSKWREEGPFNPSDSKSSGVPQEGTYMNADDRNAVISKYNAQPKPTRGKKNKARDEPLEEQSIGRRRKNGGTILPDLDAIEKKEQKAPQRASPGPSETEFAHLTSLIPSDSDDSRPSTPEPRRAPARPRRRRSRSRTRAPRRSRSRQPAPVPVEQKEEPPVTLHVRNFGKPTPPGTASKAVQLGKKNKKGTTEAKEITKIASRAARKAQTGSIPEGFSVQTVVDSTPDHATGPEIPAGPVPGDSSIPVTSHVPNTSGTTPRDQDLATRTKQPTVQTPSNPILDVKADEKAKPLPTREKKIEFKAQTDEKGVAMDTTGMDQNMIQGPDFHANMTATIDSMLAQLRTAVYEEIEAPSSKTANSFKTLRYLTNNRRERKENARHILNELAGLKPEIRAGLMMMMASPRSFSVGWHADMQIIAQALRQSALSSEEIVTGLSEDVPHPTLAGVSHGRRIQDIISDAKAYEMGREALRPDQQQALHETVQNEMVNAVEANRNPQEGVSTNMLGLAFRAATVFQGLLAYYGAKQLLVKGASVAAVAAGITPLGWAAIAGGLALDTALVYDVIKNWNPVKKGGPLGPNNPQANASGGRAPDVVKTLDTKGGDPPTSAGGAVTGDVPMPPLPDRGIIAPRGVMPADRSLPEIKRYLDDLYKKGHIVHGHIQDVQRATQLAQKLNQSLGFPISAVKQWAADKMGVGTGTTVQAGAPDPSVRGVIEAKKEQSTLQPTGDDDADMTKVDEPDQATLSTINRDTSDQRVNAVAPAPPASSSSASSSSSAPAATPRGYATPYPPPPDSKEQGRFVPVDFKQIRHYTVVLIDEKGRPYTNRTGQAGYGSYDPYAYQNGDTVHHIGLNTEYFPATTPRTTFNGQPYYFIDGMWTRGVVRDPAKVASEIRQRGYYAEKNGLWNMDKLKKSGFGLSKDEWGQVKAVADDDAKQRRAEGKDFNGPVVPDNKTPTPGSSTATVDHPDDKHGTPEGKATKGSKPTSGPPLATPVGADIPYDRKGPKGQEDKTPDNIPPELQGLVKRLTTPQALPTGDETLGQKGQTGLLRPEFMEGGANFVGEVNQDVTLNVIQNLQWQNFNNRDNWEPNEYFDNPLYLMELAQTGERFGGHLYGEELLATQEMASRYAIRHINPRINAFRDVPDSIQFQARNIFMAVQPYEGQAAKGDSDQDGFKTSIESNFEFHDAFLPCGFNWPSTGPLEKFTETDGTQYPDSARVGGLELSLHDAEPLANINNWIATTST